MRAIHALIFFKIEILEKDMHTRTNRLLKAMTYFRFIACFERRSRDEYQMGGQTHTLKCAIFKAADNKC